MDKIFDGAGGNPRPHLKIGFEDLQNHRKSGVGGLFLAHLHQKRGHKNQKWALRQPYFCFLIIFRVDKFQLLKQNDYKYFVLFSNLIIFKLQ
jgi:hypothetical protein